jgi:hypothetical protein
MMGKPEKAMVALCALLSSMETTGIRSGGDNVVQDVVSGVQVPHWTGVARWRRGMKAIDPPED